MRVLFIHTHYLQRGGEDVALEAEAALLKEKGHAVEVLIFENKIGRNPFSKLVNGIKAIYNVQSYKRTISAIQSFQPDVIHVHNLFFAASPSVLFAARKMNVPVIATIHNYRLICSNAILMRNEQVCELCIHHKVPLQGIIHKCYHSSYAASAMATGFSAIHKLMNTWNSNIDVFITLTSFARTKILQSSLKPEVDKVIVKANFCNDYDTGSEQRNHFFLFAGRLAEEKGIRHLLEAIAQTNEAIIIAGDGPLLEELKQRYLYCKNIEFKGVVQHRELIQLMKECKALIFPSIWYEVLPYVIIEAFSTGTPVLASNTGSMSSLITDGFNGFHFLPGSSEEIKKAIARFHSFPDKKILHENARAYFLKNFTADIHYQTIMNIYEIVCLQSKK